MYKNTIIDRSTVDSIVYDIYRANPVLVLSITFPANYPKQFCEKSFQKFIADVNRALLVANNTNLPYLERQISIFAMQYTNNDATAYDIVFCNEHGYLCDQKLVIFTIENYVKGLINLEQYIDYIGIEYFNETMRWQRQPAIIFTTKNKVERIHIGNNKYIEKNVWGKLKISNGFSIHSSPLSCTKNDYHFVKSLFNVPSQESLKQTLQNGTSENLNMLMEYLGGQSYSKQLISDDSYQITNYFGVECG